MKFALEGDRSTLSSLAKLAVGCMSFYNVLLYFSSIGVHLEGLGRLWRPFGPSGRPGRFRTSFFHSFFDFWIALGAQGTPKGTPRSAKATEMVPKVLPTGHTGPPLAPDPKKHKKPALLDLILVPFLYNFCIGFI